MDPQQAPTEDSIQVLVRIKPGSDDEAVVYTSSQIKVEKHTFAFDRIFPPSADQDDVYNAVGKKLLINTLEGYNSCVFVYGQTGSGKTYTMMGNNTGLMQRSFSQLFCRLNRMHQSQCIVTCSYFELYNEHIIDLLDTRKQKKSLSIRQDVKKGIFVQNLTEESALGSEKLLECLNIGMKSRHIGQTLMNRESSRSHSVFTVSLAIKSQIDGKKVLKTPKLHFVDLAGSQRQKMTNASGDRLKQAGNINKSLTTLGMVINALASEKTKTHIPYRDSKLTCLLRDSLGGNSKTFIVATISTSILCFQETLSTLNFANRAKMVKVKALINEESLSTNLEQFKEEIRRLKTEVARLKSEKRVTFESTPVPTDSVISKNNGDLQHKFSELTTKLEDLKVNINNNNMDNIIDMLSKTKDSQNSMKDENSGSMEEEGNELIEYMMSNHELLKRINTTVNDYTTLREEIKNVEFSRRMPLEEIKTPSKFQRDQYQDLVGKRQNQIKSLEEKVKILKEINLKKDSQNRELKRKLASMEDHTESKDQSLTRMQNDQQDLYKKYSELQLKYQLLSQQHMKSQRSISEYELRLKQSKQLYVYAQEKHENQRSIRNKLEQTIKELHKKCHVLSNQKKEVIDDFQNKLYTIEEKMEDGERREEELKSQLDILNQTVEFDKKKMKEYSDKVTQCTRAIQELNLNKFQLAQTVTQLQHDKQCISNQFQSSICELKLNTKQLENNLSLTRDTIKKLEQSSKVMSKQYLEYKQTSSERMSLLESQLLNEREIAKSVGIQYQALKLQFKQSVYNYDARIFQLEKCLDHVKAQYSIETNAKKLMEEKYQNEHEAWVNELSQVQVSNQSLSEKLAILTEQSESKDKKISELQTKILSTKDIVEEHQQLKKTYKEVIKENYKLKGQYMSTNRNNLNETARNEELVSKVAYYEQKFRLMSLQYNKVQEVSKKLKQKELKLLKKVEYYEESEKLKKFHHTSEEKQDIKCQNTKMLQLENSQLKESLAKMTKLYENRIQADKKEDYSKRINLEHYRQELEQKEEKIRKKLQNTMRNWDHAKENSCSGMSLEELFGCWEKIENESRKKIQGINKSIKREQKLKIQNGFIIKENSYLKEKVEAIEREMNLSSLCQPRKQIKVNQNLQ